MSEPTRQRLDRIEQRYHQDMKIEHTDLEWLMETVRDSLPPKPGPRQAMVARPCPHDPGHLCPTVECDCPLTPTSTQERWRCSCGDGCQPGHCLNVPC